MSDCQGRCLSCAYRGEMHTGDTSRPGCAYLQITGHSRLRAAYKRLGVKTLTEEVREALKPENCEQYRKGEKLSVPEVDVLLPGSTPRRKEESGPSQALRASSPRRGESQEETGDTSSGASATSEALNVARFPRVGIHVRGEGKSGEGKSGGGKSGGGKRRGRKPKIDGIRAMALYLKGLNDMEIGKALGMCETTVGAWRRRIGLPVNKHYFAHRREQMLSLYLQGMTDTQIAAEMGVKPKSAAKWRNSMELPPNPGPAQRARQERDRKMRELHSKGQTDAQIGAEMGMDAHAVACWRGRQQLPSNADRRSEWDKDKARALHAQGARDLEIADAVGISVYAIQSWRKKEGIACNRGKPGGVREITWEAQGLRLYEQGMNDMEIARAVGRTNAAIARWRKLRGLPRQAKRAKKT